jgi:hypothetical protein
MTERQSAETARDRFLEAAQKELLDFERKEREFRKEAKRERASLLRLPVHNSELPS